MKTYIQPATKVVMIQHVTFIAESFGLKNSDASNDGSTYTNALGHEDKGWDIWGSEDASEE